MTLAVASRDPHTTYGERGAGMGGYPGPALSVRLFAGHALPTGKSQIPELLSEGGFRKPFSVDSHSTGAGFRCRCPYVADA